LGIGDWAQSPIPNPQSPIPNPQQLRKFFKEQKYKYFNYLIEIKLLIKMNKLRKIIFR
jgi:hypothetical protein